MINLNNINGADEIVLEYVENLLSLKTDKPLIGVEMGIAYGGGVEAVGKLWKDRGIVYGFDTFEDLHPKHLAKYPSSLEATCMDDWYKEEIHGTEKLAYDYQRAELDRQGLDNVILRKGLVSENSCADIPYLNYCFLDMDIYESMVAGYKAVKDKVLPGHVLFLHDVMPPTHIPRLFHWYNNELLKDDKDKWRVLATWPDNYLAALIRR